MRRVAVLIAVASAVAAGSHADAVGRSPGALITTDLGGQTLTPGVYAAGAAMTLAGTLTLDARGNPAAVFILQAGSTLTTGALSQVDLVGGAQACNVFWQVGTSATLGATSQLAGTILATTSISMGADVTIDGRALARDAAVTMIGDTVNAAVHVVGVHHRAADHDIQHAAHRAQSNRQHRHRGVERHGCNAEQRRL